MVWFGRAKDKDNESRQLPGRPRPAGRTVPYAQQWTAGGSRWAHRVPRGPEEAASAAWALCEAANFPKSMISSCMLRRSRSSTQGRPLGASRAPQCSPAIVREVVLPSAAARPCPTPGSGGAGHACFEYLRMLRELWAVLHEHCSHMRDKTQHLAVVVQGWCPEQANVESENQCTYMIRRTREPRDVCSLNAA